jgi:DNA polymerase-1
VAAERGEKGYLRAYGVELHLVRSMDDLFEFKRWLGESRDILCYDTENTGFSPERDHVRMAQFGDMHTGWAIPFERWGGAALEVLKTYEGTIGAHNLKYDARMTMAEEPSLVWPWHRSHDSMNMAHILNSRRTKGLKPLAGMLIDPEAVAAQRQLDQGMHANKWNWSTVPIDFPPYWIYAAMDPVLTSHMLDIMLPQMGPYQYVYDLEMGTTRAIAKMEQRGMRIDTDYVIKKNAELQDYVARATDWLHNEFKITSVNSGAQLIRYFESEGIEIPDKKTNGGAQSMDKSVLEQIPHVVAETVLAIKKADKTIGPYFSNFIEMVDAEDRVHPNVWTLGARTGRMSVSEPALQTLPRKDPTVRTAFIPSEGNAIVTCDFDQIEARLMAHFSESQALIDAFNRPEDFFLQMASQIYAVEVADKKDPRRQLSKNGTYGKIYGAGIDKMAETAGVSSEQMQAVMGRFDALYPEVKRMQKQITTLGATRLRQEGEGYIKTPYGRRLSSDPGKEYTLVNYLIQGHAAELMKRKIIDLDTLLDDGMLLLPVHDEIVCDVPREDADELSHVIADSMADRTNYKVPITCGTDVLMDNWGEKYR